MDTQRDRAILENLFGRQILRIKIGLFYDDLYTKNFSVRDKLKIAEFGVCMLKTLEFSYRNPQAELMYSEPNQNTKMM